MAFLDDVRDWVAGEISHIGLGTDATTEVSGGGYTHVAVTYTDGVLNGAPLDFVGTPGLSVTYVMFKRSGVLWVARPVAPQQFNAEGDLQVTASSVSAAFPVG